MTAPAEKKPGTGLREVGTRPTRDAAQPTANDAPLQATNEAGVQSAAERAALRAAHKAARAARKAALRAALQNAALERVADLPVANPAQQTERRPVPRADATEPAAADRRALGASKAQAEAVRRARSVRLARRIAVFVVLPTVLATIYYTAVATEQYESYSLFTVQSSEARPSLGVEGLLAGITGNTAGHDALTVRDYVLSRDMLAKLDKELGFINHYKAGSSDWFSRLASSASFEESYEYYGKKVYADYDQTTGAVTLRVRAFTAEKAVAISKNILASSEEMVNKLSERQRRDRIAYAEADLKQAEQRLTRARKEIVSLQQKHADFSPLQTAGAAMTIRTALEGELAKARAELMQLKSFMNDDAPQVRAANEKIKAISAQVASESRRLVDPSKPNGLNASFSDFEAAMVEKEFSEKVYQSSLASLELARTDADRQHRYLAVVAQPSKPDTSTYPHRVRGVLAAFFLSFLLLGIGSLMVAAVREHARL
jgi:capsular polysaccharide transport system permease protein